MPKLTGVDVGVNPGAGAGLGAITGDLLSQHISSSISIQNLYHNLKCFEIVESSFYNLHS